MDGNNSMSHTTLPIQSPGCHLSFASRTNINLLPQQHISPPYRLSPGELHNSNEDDNNRSGKGIEGEQEECSQMKEERGCQFKDLANITPEAQEDEDSHSTLQIGDLEGESHYLNLGIAEIVYERFLLAFNFSFLSNDNNKDEKKTLPGRLLEYLKAPEFDQVFPFLIPF